MDRDEELPAQCSKESRARVYAKERVMRGALQIAASRLLEQGTQETAGDHEMHESIRDLDAAREESRRAFAATSATALTASRTRPARQKKPKT